MCDLPYIWHQRIVMGVIRGLAVGEGEGGAKRAAPSAPPCHTKQNGRGPIGEAARRPCRHVNVVFSLARKGESSVTA